MVEEKLEENSDQENGRGKPEENSDQKSGRKKFREISGKSTIFKQRKAGMLLWLMKFLRPEIVKIDGGKMINKTANDWSSEIIDVETAFLYGDLNEEIYMTIPKGLEEYMHQDLKNKCVKLKKSIYGLVQAARAWWKNSQVHFKILDFRNVHQITV